MLDCRHSFVHAPRKKVMATFFFFFFPLDNKKAWHGYFRSTVSKRLSCNKEGSPGFPSSGCCLCLGARALELHCKFISNLLLNIRIWDKKTQKQNYDRISISVTYMNSCILYH